jgi:uncharacterized membrane protein YkvI
MDESALQSRLAAVERRQYVIIALLVVPYAYWLGTKIGFWTAGVLYVVLAVVGFAALMVSRRRNRATASG